MDLGLVDSCSVESKVELSSFEIDDAASFEIILKIQETCNLNCSYCYMYNQGNKLFELVPPSCSVATCEAVALAVVQEFTSRNPRHATVILHGGEPTLMPIHRFRERLDAMLAIFSEQLTADQRRKVLFSLQTNATLITDEWIRLFEEYNISVSVTIDGPQEFHDLTRIDHQGRGSYKRVEEGVRKLIEAESRGQIKSLGCLLVINPDLDGARAFDHLTDGLRFRRIDFLLPFRDWETATEDETVAIGRFLSEAFVAWTGSLSDVKVRIFERAIQAISGSGLPRENATGRLRVEHFYVVIESDGTIMPDESVRPHLKERAAEIRVGDMTLQETLFISPFHELTLSHMTLDRSCEGCALINACKSGRTLGRVGSRFSVANNYNNHSTFCKAYEQVFTNAAGFLIRNGLSLNDLNLV